MSDVASQVEAGLRYIRERYGNEDPGGVFAAYDAGPKGIASTQAAAAPYECSFCERGQCSRCSDRKCACCAGHPED